MCLRMSFHRFQNRHALEFAEVMGKSVASKRRNFRLDAKTAVFIATNSLKRRNITIVSGAPSVSDGHRTSVQE